MSNHSTTSAMTTGPLVPMLNRVYESSLPYQWAREAAVNSLQAGANTIRFTTEWQAAREFDVHRRMILDDGPGIPRSQMRDFLNKFGGSGKTLAAKQENFGVGLKTSLLPWNKYGLVLISKTANGEITMMWLRHDPDLGDEHGTFGALMFDLNQGEAAPSWDDVVSLENRKSFEFDGIDWCKVFPEDQESGFAVILLGDSGEEDTIHGDPSRGEDRKYGLKQYLSSRFMSVENCSVIIDEYPDDRDKWPLHPQGSRKRRSVTQTRRARGLIETIEYNTKPTKAHPNRGLADSGVVEVPETKDMPGVRIHWWLAAEKIDRATHEVTFPITGIMHEAHEGIQEIFDLTGNGARSTVSPVARMNQYMTIAPIRERLAIIFEPLSSERFEIFPDQSRTILKFTSDTISAQEMPREYWKQIWDANLPEAILQARRDYFAALGQDNDEGTDRDMIRLGSQYGDKLKRFYVNQNRLGAGSQTGTPTGPVPGRMAAKKKSAATGKTTKPTTTTKSATSNGGTTSLADQQQKKWANLGLVPCRVTRDPDDDRLVYFDDVEKVSLLNASHPRFVSMVEDIIDRYVEEERITAEDSDLRTIIEKEVVKAAKFHVFLAVSEAVAAVAANPSDRDTILSPATLSASLYGQRHIEVMCAKPIGHALRGSRATRTAA